MLDLTLLTLPFFQRALAIGLALGLIMALLGVIVILRRMSFFSDAIGHAALTGIAAGLLLNLNPFTTALIYSLLIAASLALIKRHTNLSLDTLLGVFFATSVALGVILIQLTPGYQANLISFLFGDILTVSSTDVVLTLLVTVIVGFTLLFSGKKFIAIAFNAPLAKAEGIAVSTYELVLLLILAAVIALSIKLVGVILVTALLVIPAASAHNISRSLTTMFIFSTIFSLVSVTLGMLASATLNTASGPTIVLVSAIFFAFSLFLKPILKIS